MNTRDEGTAHDLIVVGGSAGAVPVVQQLLRQLPADLPAAVLVVVHLGQTTAGPLAAMLAQGAAMTVTSAADGEMAEPGRVYVATADHHLLVERADDGRPRLRLSRGPKENRFRPAIDPLFRTAARAMGPRVVGVILSGLLDDGTLGLMWVKQFGGLAVVQDPLEAAHPDMPASAVRHVRVDRVLRADELADELARVARTPVPAAALVRGRERTDGEAAMTVESDLGASRDAGPDGVDAALRGDDALARGAMVGPPSALTCPSCGGAVWERADGGLLHYRCHVGHRYTAQSMAAEQQSVLEATLWESMRMFQERAALHWRMAAKTDADGQPDLAARFRERAGESEAHTEVVRRLLMSESGPAGPD